MNDRRPHRRVPLAATAKEAGRTTGRQAGPGWTLVLRGQPIRIVDGQTQGGCTDVFELICCDCGDDPDLDYRDVSPELQQIRGPFPIAAGIAAYKKHVVWHQTRQPTHPGESSVARGRCEQGLMHGYEDHAAVTGSAFTGAACGTGGLREAVRPAQVGLSTIVREPGRGHRRP